MSETKVTINELDNSDGAIAGVWKSWTPTFTNLTIGNAVVNAKYTKVSKTISFRLSIKLGTTSTVGTTPFFTLPAAAANYGATSAEMQIGLCECLNSGVASFLGVISLATTTTAYFTSYSISGASISKSGLSATSPFTFTTNSEINCTGTYEAA